MSLLFKRYASLTMAACLTVLILSVSACQVQLIAPYDEQIDKSSGELQKRMDTHLTDLVGLLAGAEFDLISKGEEAKKVPLPAEAQYQKHITFYRDYSIDLRALYVRASSWSKNEKTIDQIKLIQDNLNLLVKLHRRFSMPPMADKPFNPRWFLEFRRDFNLQFTALLAFELGKKRDSAPVQANKNAGSK